MDRDFGGAGTTSESRSARHPKKNEIRPGFVAEKIIDAKDFGPDRHRYLISMYDKPELEYVDSKIAKKRCPQLVIEYFERQRSWSYFNQHAVAEAQRKAWRDRLKLQNEEHNCNRTDKK